MTDQPEAPDEFVVDCSTYYGIKLVDVGEDGDVLVLGHHNDRRVLAALNRHARTVWGEPISDSYEGAAGNLEQHWARLMTECEDARQPDHAEHEPCWKCREIADALWFVTWGAKADEPGAFPVTRWAA